MYITRPSASTVSIKGNLALYLVGVAAVIVIGSVIAIAPSFAARLIPFLILPVIVALGLIARSSEAISEMASGRWLLILVVVLAIWPSYMLFKFVGLPSIDGRKIVSGLSLVAFVYLWVSRKTLLAPMKGRAARYYLTGITLISLLTTWQIIASLGSVAPFASLMLVAWNVVNYYFLFVLGVVIFRGENHEDRLVIVLMAVSCLISVFTAVEWVMGKNVLVAMAPKNDDFAEFNAMMAIERVRDGYFRAQGTFEHPLVLAEFSAMTACFGLASLLFPGGRLRRLIGFLTLALAILSAWFSGSRAAFVALGLGLTVVFLLWIYHSRVRVRKSVGAMRRLFFLFSLCGVAALALPTIILLSQGRTSTESTSTEARMYMLRIGVPSVMANPVLGLGPGSAGAVAGIKGGAGVSTLDNHLLAIAIESGIPGLILFLACLIYPAWGAITRLAHGAGTSSTFLAGGVGAVGAFVVTRSILSIPYNQAFAFLIAGMMIAATARHISAEDPA